MDNLAGVPSPETKKLNLLEQEANANSKRFLRKLFWYRNLSLLLRIALAVVAGLVTIFAGWKRIPQGENPTLMNCALIAGTLVLVFNTVHSFFKPKKLWLVFDEAVVSLEHFVLQVKLVKCQDPSTLTADSVEHLHQVYKGILVKLRLDISEALDEGETASSK